MQISDLSKMELMAESLRKQPAFLMQESPWSPHQTNLLQQHSMLSKIWAPVHRVIAIRSSSWLSKFPTLAAGKASDQVALWLCCATSS